MSAKADMPTCCVPLFRRRCKQSGVECKITTKDDLKNSGEPKNQPGWENIPLDGTKQPDAALIATPKDTPAVTPTTQEDSKIASTTASEAQKAEELTPTTNPPAPETTTATKAPIDQAQEEAEIIIDLDQEAALAPVASNDESTGEVLVSLDNWAKQAIAKGSSPSKIPHCPSKGLSPAASQELTVVLDSSTTLPTDSPKELQTVMQNLLPAIAPNAAGSPNSPITIVNISVNHYSANYKLQPDGTWAAPEEPPRPNSGFGRAGSAKAHGASPSAPKMDPATGKPVFNRNTKTPGTFGPAPAVPKRIGSAPKKLAITES